MSRDVGVPLGQIHVIRNGVDLTRFRGSRAAFGRLRVSDAGAVVIGAVGRLVAVKDHAAFIDAIAMLRARGRRVAGVIAGEGPLRPDLEARIARLGLEGTVRLLGHCRDVETMLAGLDIFVQSSTSEGMSNTILEAMAAGLPIVATGVGGADEMVVDGETGILVPPAEPGNLADALDRLLQGESLRHAMGRAGEKRAQGEFSLERMIATYQSFYCDIMRDRLRRREEPVRPEEALST